jgi:hypothetical protein
MAALLVCFGLFLAVAAPWFDRPVFLREALNDQDVRFRVALATRTRADRLPWPLMAAIACVMVILAAAVWYRGIDVSVAWSLAYAAFGMGILVGYLRLRRPQARSAAILTRRNVAAFVPYYLFVLAVLVALCPLFYASIPAVAIPAIIATCCSLITIFVSIRLATLPAVLSGDDPTIEAELDNRLRSNRVRVFLSLAFVEVFLFTAYINLSAVRTLWAAHLELAVAVAFGVFSLWSISHGTRCNTGESHASQ